uniref:Uncharacterized protein n=1 Tax=Avena sativa TaxID=4498 RepID=A0ACD5UHM5_AVESA
MEKAPEGAALGALGLAGICRETLRVILSFPPGFPFMCGMLISLTLSLLAHVAVSRALFSDAFAASDDDGGAGFVRLAANWAPFLLAEAVFLFIIVFQLLGSAAFCVLSVAPRYSGFATDADRDARSVARDLREVPRFLAKYFVKVFHGDSRLAARLVRTGPGVFVRVAATSWVAFLLLLGYTALLAAVFVLMHLPRPALLLGGGAAYLAGAAHIGAVWRVACVLSVMEDGARGSRAMHASDELLTAAGKFWAAAAVFATLDGHAVAVLLAFGALVVDDRMGLGVWVRVAVGAVMATALWATAVAVLVAQVVVYFVCKSYRRRCESSDGAVGKSPITDVSRKGRATRTRK